MNFSHSCFISYYPSRRAQVRQLVDDLHEVLKAELELCAGEPMFPDVVEIGGDEGLERDLARALCQSACMVVIFEPSYFSEDETDCARQYLAMLKIEEMRLKVLKQTAVKTHGMIIPVVLRGARDSNPELSRRIIYNFEHCTMLGTPSKHPAYRPLIKQIAQSICERTKAFKEFESAPWGDCSGARLPSELEARKWLPQVKPRELPFPSRMGNA